LALKTTTISDERAIVVDLVLRLGVTEKAERAETAENAERMAGVRM